MTASRHSWPGPYTWEGLSDADHLRASEEMREIQGVYGIKQISDEAILDALREADAAGYHGGVQYGNMAAVMGWPTIRTVVVRFGSWVEARQAAGLPLNERVGTRGMRWHVSPEYCLEAVVECAVDLDHLPSYNDYVAWRRGQPESRRSTKSGSGELMEAEGRLPCGATVRQYLGGWVEVKRMVLPRLVAARESQ